VAAQAAPDDLVVQKRMAEVITLADRALAPKFLEQARYEEKDGQFDRAARSYERAARGKESAELFDKAAQCLLRSAYRAEDDKRKLVELARKCVTLDNRCADYRLTLARAYDVAGMRTSAQGEVRRALELEPDNKHAKELQKALK
jgi:tetratricopeptide (TPR) repeat protein